MNGWARRTSPMATAIGARAVALIDGHNWGRPLDDRDRVFIARACALAADEAFATARATDPAPAEAAHHG